MFLFRKNNFTSFFKFNKRPKVMGILLRELIIGTCRKNAKYDSLRHVSYRNISSICNNTINKTLSEFYFLFKSELLGYQNSGEI